MSLPRVISILGQENRVRVEPRTRSRGEPPEGRCCVCQIRAMWGRPGVADGTCPPRPGPGRLQMAPAFRVGATGGRGDRLDSASWSSGSGSARQARP